MKGTVKLNYRLGLILKLLVRPANLAMCAQGVRTQINGSLEIPESRIVTCCERVGLEHIAPHDLRSYAESRIMPNARAIAAP